MNRVYILVEGSTDEAFLRRILPPEVLGRGELVNAGGSAGIPSLARSLVVRRKSPVLVLMDSDSMDPDMIEERQQSTEDLIRSADASVPVKVILAVPEIEAWFFATPEIIERVIGQKVSEEWLSQGKRDPKRFLNHLADSNEKRWDTQQAISALNPHDIERILAIPAVVELSKFLQEIQKTDQAA